MNTQRRFNSHGFSLRVALTLSCLIFVTTATPQLATASDDHAALRTLQGKNRTLAQQRKLMQQKVDKTQKIKIKPLKEKTPAAETYQFLNKLKQDPRIIAINEYVANHPNRFRNGLPYSGILIANLGDRAKLMVGAAHPMIEIGIREIWRSGVAGEMIDYPATIISKRNLGNDKGLSASPKDINKAIDKVVKALANDAPIVEDFSG